MTVHHCFTGGGGRKDHTKTICLCWGHHLGPEGIDGQRMSKRQWQEKYGSEESLLAKTDQHLALMGRSPGQQFFDALDENAALTEIEAIVRRVQEKANV